MENVECKQVKTKCEFEGNENTRRMIDKPRGISNVSKKARECNSIDP